MRLRSLCVQYIVYEKDVTLILLSLEFVFFVFGTILSLINVVKR